MLHRRPLPLIGVACLIATSLACGSGGDEPLTPEEAAAVVQAGLLTEEDLPAADWQIEDVDNLVAEESTDGEMPADPDDLFESTEACQEVAAIMEDLDTSDTPPLADIERTFATGDESLMVRSVVSNVFVPDPEVDTDGTFDALRNVFSADTMRPCFESAFTSSMESEEGLMVSRIDVYTPGTLIEDGVGIALDLEAIALIIPINLHLEIHMWPEGPAVGSLMLMEMNSDLLTDDASFIVEDAQTRLQDAVEGG